MIQFDEHTFQMGWFNHQQVKDIPLPKGSQKKDGEGQTLEYPIPIGSMYGIFTIYLPRYIYPKHQLNVGKYTTHGFYGISCLLKISCFMFFFGQAESHESPREAGGLELG